MRKIAGVLIISMCLVLLIVAVFPRHSNAETIYGCVTKGGTLKIESGPGLCAKGETPLSWNLAVKTTFLNFTGGNNGPNSSENNWMQYTFISPTNLSFTKYYDNSTLFVTWTDTLGGVSITGGLGFCHWKLSIDGIYFFPDIIRMPVRTNLETNVPISLKSVMLDLPAGDHNVQLWFETRDAGCYNNAGGWGRTVTIVEVPN